MCIRLAIVVVLLLLLVGGGIVAAAATGVFKSPEVVSAQHSWGEVNETTTTVITDLVINNPNPVGIAVGRASVVVEVRFNDVLLGRAESEGIDLQKGKSSNRVITRIDNNQVPGWWASHIAGGEHTQWTLNVRLESKVFGRTVSVPVTDESGQFSTHIIERINAYDPEPLGFRSFFVDVGDVRFRWTDVTTDRSVLAGTVSLHNRTPVSLNVVAADYSLVLNGIRVGEGTSAPDIRIAADEVNEIPLSFTVDHHRLQEWWPTHISGGEQSAMNVEIALTIGGQLPQPVGSVELRLPVISVSDTLQTDLLER